MKTLVHIEKKAWEWLKDTIPKLNWKKSYFIEITQYSPKRSASVNRLYRMWLTFLKNNSGSGCVEDELHEIFIDKFSPRYLIGDKEYPKRTKKMSSVEFWKYLNDIHHYSYHEWACHLAYPENEEDFKAWVKEYYETKGNYEVFIKESPEYNEEEEES